MFKVIIVDDERITRRGLIEYVNWAKLEIEVAGEASDGVEGLELAMAVKPDIIICDVRMPKMNGLNMVESLRETGLQTKVVFLSGFSEKEYLKSAIKLGAVDYLEKPINLIEFNELLSKIVDELKEESVDNQEQEEIKNKLNQGNQYLIDSIVDKAISGREIDEVTVKNTLNHMNIRFPLEFDCRVVVIKSAKMNQIPVLLKAMMECREKLKFTMLFGVKGLEIISIHTHKVGILELTEFYALMIEIAAENTEIKTYIGIGEEYKGFKNSKESYVTAVETIEWKGFKNINKPVYNDEKRISALIRDVEKYIDKKYSENITIKDIADKVYITPQYLCKIYKKETGETINGYITNLRMEKAINLMDDRRYKIFEIAIKLGYKDPNYFARVFKKHTGKNPSEYREEKGIR